MTLKEIVENLNTIRHELRDQFFSRKISTYLDDIDESKRKQFESAMNLRLSVSHLTETLALLNESLQDEVYEQ